MPARSLDPRSGHAIAYDAVRQRVVLFGGLQSSSSWFGDTWEWDGGSWTRRTPVTSPLGRWGHAMTYDASSARYWHAMAYDSVRRRVVVLSGAPAQGPGVGDTWEWDGSNWTLQSPATNPGSRTWHAMAYDIARQRVVLFGGVGGESQADTWLYGSLDRTAARPVGSACAGSNGPPLLTSTEPHLGNPAFRLELISARAGAPCVFGLSAGTQSLPIGPCTLYLKDVLPLVAVSNGAGFASTPNLPLPLDVTLRGLTLYAQAFVVDPQGPVLGLAFSAGRRLVLGD